MILFRHAVASVLVVVLVISAAPVRADAGIHTREAPEAPPTPAPTPAAAAQQPPGVAKIEWRDIFWDTRYGHVEHTEKPYLNGRLLECQALYRTLGRPDLAAAYGKRQESKSALGIVTGIFLATTLILAVIAGTDQKSGQAVPTGLRIAFGVSLGLTGTVAIANAATPTDILTDEQLHRLIDAHNRTP